MIHIKIIINVLCSPVKMMTGHIKRKDINKSGFQGFLRRICLLLRTYLIYKLACLNFAVNT